MLRARHLIFFCFHQRHSGVPHSSPVHYFCEPPFCFSLSPLSTRVPPFSFHTSISAFVDFQIHSILPHFSVYHSTHSPLLIYSHLRTGHSFSFKYFIHLHSNSIHSRSVPFQLLLFIPI